MTLHLWLANSVTQLKYRFNAITGVTKAPAVMSANAVNIAVAAVSIMLHVDMDIIIGSCFRRVIQCLLLIF